MKRLLAIDGGGIRGVLALQILARMEHLLRKQQANPDYRLSDHFHYIGGTSTGAIIAACLSWGMQVSEILDLYLSHGAKMFRKRALWGRFWTKFDHQQLAVMLQRMFSEDGQGRRPALLGSERLKTRLLIVTRNATTGSPWPLTNNPDARFNQSDQPGDNLLLPLWQIVRASTAAPTFFPPERVIIRGDPNDPDDRFGKPVECLFEDGGITPFNNPAHLLFLKATLPEYRTCWPTGTDRLHLVSVGTGYTDFGRASNTEPHLIDRATRIPFTLMQTYQANQDLLCRLHGQTMHGAPLDSELGDLVRPNPQAQFTYVRYNHRFTPDDCSSLTHRANPSLPIDDLSIIPFLREFGESFAKSTVKIGHLR